MAEEIKTELKAIMSSLNELKSLLNEVKSIKTLTEQTNSNVNLMAKQMKNLEIENNQLKSDVTYLYNENIELKLRLDEMKQYTRKDNILIWW